MNGGPPLVCRDETRRDLVRAMGANGIDYVELEVFESPGVPLERPYLCVHFFGRVPRDLTVANVRLAGGRRIAARDIHVLEVLAQASDDPERDDCLRIVLDRTGDRSPYTLSLVEPVEGRPGDLPLAGFDPRYARIEFRFDLDCASTLDCAAPAVCPPPERPEPVIDYLAKDYASFRGLVLDRLALLLPDWTERHVPDLGITLVELLAYAGDHLSYLQDAVATEAYLGTARLRTSVRRHARLVDYPMHDGCNARAWVTAETDTELVELDPRQVYFVTGLNDVFDREDRVLAPEDLREVARAAYEIFEPAEAATIRFRAAHSRIRFHDWGDRQCCLPKGATSATLVDVEVLEEPEPPSEPDQCKPGDPPPAPRRRRLLALEPGDVLVLEEVRGSVTGLLADADPAHRQAVRLIHVTPTRDPATDTPVVEIEWAAEDALRFPLCISTLGGAPECELLDDVSVARGNVVLVDHGETTTADCGRVECDDPEQRCEREHVPADVVERPRPFRPRLEDGPITSREPPARSGPATLGLGQDPRRALPVVALVSERETNHGRRGRERHRVDWEIRRDLFGSSAVDPHFVAEVEDDGRARLRFGDGELGLRPGARFAFHATYRVGNGRAGNVGAEAISHLVLRNERRSGESLRVRNPMPAEGGVEPEPIAEVKQLAPFAFRARIERAVTAADYAAIAEREEPDVQRATATLRWTGSWYEATVGIDPRGTEERRPALLDAIERKLERYRRMGHDVVVLGADYVPLKVALTVHVRPHHLRGHVEAAVREVLGTGVLASGRRGVFHPDNLSFGEAVALSPIVAVVQAVEGVESVVVDTFTRYFEPSDRERTAGVLTLAPNEIAQLRNDPNFPEEGTLELNMRGGR